MRAREYRAARKRADAAGDRLGQVPQRWRMNAVVNGEGVRAVVEVTYVTGTVMHSLTAATIAELTEKLKERGLT